MIDNVGHTWASTKQLAVWRMTLAHCFSARPFSEVSMTSETEGAAVHVHAEVKTSNRLEGVRIFFATSPTARWTDATWQSCELEKSKSSYQATLTRRPADRLAYYVELGSSGRGLIR